MSRRGRPAREDDLAGWEGLALAILRQAIKDGALSWFDTPWAKVLVEGLGGDGERFVKRLKSVQDKASGADY